MTFAVGTITDAFALLRDLPGEQVDHIITDPPYPEHVQGNMCSGSLIGTKSVPKYELPFPALADAQTALLAHECPRVARRWVALFCSLESFGLFKSASPDGYVRSCIWAKKNAMGQLTGDRPATAYEGVALLHRPAVKKRWNGRGSYGIWSCNGTRGKKDRHPNEKPVDLMLKLVALLTDRGDTVLDPFCGSGAIGEACVRLGRNYVGFDNDPFWAGQSRERLKTVEAYGVPVTDAEALGLCKMWGKDADSA